MAGRLLMKNAAPLAGKLLKPMSPVTSIGVRSKVDVTIDSNTGIATITMNSPPANVMGPKFIQEMTEAISTVESEAKGAILTSGLPTIFSAGLDIMVMYQPTEERLRTFWTALQDMWLALYSCGKPIVSVINGQAPAGGCLMSCSTDHRIMLEYENDGQGKPNRIGLNETKLGIIAPFWFKDCFEALVGMRETERALQLGTLFDANEALEIGLVDEIVQSNEEGLERAQEVLKEYMKVPSFARSMTKLQVRKPVIQKFGDGRDEDLETFCNFIPQKSVQSAIGKYLEAMKAKAKM